MEYTKICVRCSNEIFELLKFNNCLIKYNITFNNHLPNIKFKRVDHLCNVDFTKEKAIYIEDSSAQCLPYTDNYLDKYPFVICNITKFEQAVKHYLQEKKLSNIKLVQNLLVTKDDKTQSWTDVGQYEFIVNENGEILELSKNCKTVKFDPNCKHHIDYIINNIESDSTN